VRCIPLGLALGLPIVAIAAAVDPLQVDDVLAAIEQVESAGRPWTIFDNSSGQSIQLSSRAEAEQVAAIRLGQGHNLDLGLYQINTIQLRRQGVGLATIFDPGVQQQLARTILAEFLARARAIYGDTQLAWERAIGAYNAGNVAVDNEPYVARVMRAMRRAPLTRASFAPLGPSRTGRDLLDARDPDRPDPDTGVPWSAPAEAAGGPVAEPSGAFGVLAAAVLVLAVASGTGIVATMILRALAGATLAFGLALARAQPLPQPYAMPRSGVTREG